MKVIMLTIGHAILFLVMVAIVMYLLAQQPRVIWSDTDPETTYKFYIKGFFIFASIVVWGVVAVLYTVGVDKLGKSRN
jgi:hypothetical protein